MNAVEIEEAVSEFVAQPLDPHEFPYQFIEAFGAKKTTIDRLRRGDSNQSDVGGVLQRNNIHIAVAPIGEVGAKLAALRASPKTASAKAKFILATDGNTVEAEDLVGGDVIACPYADLPRHFAIFLPLAGISTVKEIKNNPIDIKATGRLNKLYIELLRDNPDWASEERRHALNQFMARLIFCFFAEDTGIFEPHLFTKKITELSHAGHGSGDAQWGDTHEVMAELFRAMDTPTMHEGNLDDRYRRAAGIRPYADVFPYVNGGLFNGAIACPRFSRAARAYLLRAGELDWKEINPDIFGSMIQAVADDSERGELGMHYTSVPNILKVLNPLFLDDLHGALEAAGDSRQKLRNLRKRLASIRVFDPACGSGNFLVIAYKEMRAIEAEIVKRLGGEGSLKLADRRSVIPLSNFYGIEIKGFAAEIARLALLIAEFQADCLYLSQQEARAMVLPLHRTGQIKVGNALREDWTDVCPLIPQSGLLKVELKEPEETSPVEENSPTEDADVETFICGNPPYLGSTWQSADHKADLEAIFANRTDVWKSLDYVAGWLMKAADYGTKAVASSAFVTTNSICQGQQVAILWPLIFSTGRTIAFAHTSFKWANLASHNAGVTVIVVGLTGRDSGPKRLYTTSDDEIDVRLVSHINAYLTSGPDVIVTKRSEPFNGLAKMDFGSKPVDGGHLLLDTSEYVSSDLKAARDAGFLRVLYGSDEFINARPRYCIWVEDSVVEEAAAIPNLKRRFDLVAATRSASSKERTRRGAAWPYRFDELRQNGRERIIVVPAISSENRDYLPCGLLPVGTIINNKNYALYDAPIWNLALVASRMHWVWIGTVCMRLEMRFSYSNTLGWNTFPVPKLTEQGKADLTRTAENILLAREAHFPASIADLYDPDNMPDDLRRAHEENDETLERIYIGRRFRNDTERLEKLFDLYTKTFANAPKPTKRKKAA